MPPKKMFDGLKIVLNVAFIPIQFCCRKEPTEKSNVARSGEDITTTQCEAYELANLNHEYEDLSEYHNLEYEIPVTQCPAYVHTRMSGE